jgi:hypothetical protein
MAKVQKRSCGAQSEVKGEEARRVEEGGGGLEGGGEGRTNRCI